MDVRNCRTCGRLFNYLSGPNLCQECRDALEKKFADVKDYIRDNPHSSISEIAEANEIDTKQIKQWIREERLQFADDSPVGIECEGCGATIKTGRFCDACRKNMANLFDSQINKPAPPEPPKKKEKEHDKMRFI